MGNGGYRLHFNGVHFFKRMVQDAWCVNCLETKVFVVKVANKQRLCCKGIWLDVNICSCNGLQETRFANVRITTDQQSPGIWIDAGQSAQVLANLLQVDKRIL